MASLLCYDGMKFTVTYLLTFYSYKTKTPIALKGSTFSFPDECCGHLHLWVTIEPTTTGMKQNRRQWENKKMRNTIKTIKRKSNLRFKHVWWHVCEWKRDEMVMEHTWHACYNAVVWCITTFWLFLPYHHQTCWLLVCFGIPRQQQLMQTE